MKTNSSRKTALIVVIIFIAFALGFYWLGKDNNTLSTQTDAEAQTTSLEAPLSAVQVEALAKLEKQMPVIGTIKKLSPEAYSSFEQIVRDYEPSNELLTRHIFDQIVGSVMQLVIERIPYASDKSVINFTSKVNDYLNVLLETDPSGKTCFYSLFPYLRDSAAIIPPAKSHAVLFKQLEATNDLLLSTESGIKQPMVLREEQAAILDGIQKKLVAKYGDQTLLLENLDKAKQQPAVTCRITMSFYDQILAIPDNQKKAAFLRALFSAAN
ncbi:topoisomerase IV [Providencia vermicola]|uniref:topoisomerase IV n=1 Tax=Providencia vermicola TaxID=333965 RepID=UPI0013A75C2E|nr:topoisomerase IV [Providencia vermicola]QIC15238.1 topoisomerase IV [Providencia vermicola]